MQTTVCRVNASETGGQCQMLRSNEVPKVDPTQLATCMVFADVASTREGHALSGLKEEANFFFLESSSHIFSGDEWSLLAV